MIPFQFHSDESKGAEWNFPGGQEWAPRGRHEHEDWLSAHPTQQRRLSYQILSSSPRAPFRSRYPIANIYTERKKEKKKKKRSLTMEGKGDNTDANLNLHKEEADGDTGTDFNPQIKEENDDANPVEEEDEEEEEDEDDDGADYYEDISISGDVESITDYKSLLFSKRTDYLIRNNGEQVKAGDAVHGKTIGVYFANGTNNCQLFTSTLVEAYNGIKSAGGNFEVVFVPKNPDRNILKAFAEMPWLAVPFRKLKSFGWWENIYDAFGAQGVPYLAIIDGSSGEMVLQSSFMYPVAVEMVMQYGAKAFPFTEQRLAELKDMEEEAKRNQTVISVLTSASRDFLLTADGTKVPVSELEGKMVAIYFYVNNEDNRDNCEEFCQILSGMYSELKGRGEPFEVVLIFLYGDEDDYKAQTKDMPWLLLPFEDTSGLRLTRYFEQTLPPSLVLLGADGKTVNENLQDIVKEYGARAYPFSSARIAEADREIRDEQTLESLLVSDDLDYVLGKNGSKVPVKDLVGKTVLILYAACWSPGNLITSRLVEVYEELRSKQIEVEVIFVSKDEDEASFDQSYSEMPWLALPFGDKRQSFLPGKLKLQSTFPPILIALDPSGRTITTDAVELLVNYGAKAFPFTDEHIRKVEEES